MLAPFSISAADSSSATEPKAKAERFFVSLVNNKIEPAFTELMGGSFMATSQPGAINVLQNQTETAFKIYGVPFEFELVREEQVSPSVTRLVYFLKTDKQPTNWELYFYKAKSTWVLSQIAFADQYNFIGSKK